VSLQMAMRNGSYEIIEVPILTKADSWSFKGSLYSHFYLRLEVTRNEYAKYD